MKPVLFSRRHMLRTAAVAACAPALRFAPAAGVVPSGFRIGVCDWTLGKRADPAALEMAHKLGLDGIQVDFGLPKSGMPLFKPEVQEIYRATAKKLELEIASMAIGAMNSVPYKSDPRAEEWVANGIDVCSALGVKTVLLAFFGNGDLRDDSQGIDAVIRKLRQVTPKAEKAGVTLGFESWLSAQQHMDILERVGSSALRVYYDVANSHKMGYDVPKEIRLLGKRICEFHAKDYDGLYGKGSMDFTAVRRAMDDIGYRGWLHMEGTEMPLGIEGSCRYDLEYLRTIFPRSV